MRVRPAEAGDLAAVAAVHVASWRAAYVGLIPQDFLDGLDVELRRRRWEEIRAGDTAPTAMLVLEDDAGTVIGFIHYGPTRDDGGDPATTGAVNALYLLERSWGVGGGRVLLGAAEDDLRRAGFRHATLWVLVGNERAYRFYERQLWRRDGATNKHDWGPFVADELRYAKELADPDVRD